MKRSLWLALFVALALSLALAGCKPKLVDLSFADISAENKLIEFESYRLHTVTSLEQNGETSSYDVMTECVREPAAQRLVFTGTDEADSLELIIVEGISYYRSGSEWITMQSSEQDLTEAVTAWSPQEYLHGEQARFMGKETINGLETKHYIYDDPSVFDFSGLTEGSAEVWVSTEYGVAVRTILDITGEDENGPATLQIESNLTDINQPIAIQAPEGVEKPGLPKDIPLMEGATDINAMSGFVIFTVARSVEDVVTFYESALQDEGWKIENVEASGMLGATKDTRTVSIMVSDQDDGSSQVMISIVEN